MRMTAAGPAFKEINRDGLQQRQRNKDAPQLIWLSGWMVWSLTYPEDDTGEMVGAPFQFVRGNLRLH